MHKEWHKIKIKAKGSYRKYFIRLITLLRCSLDGKKLLDGPNFVISCKSSWLSIRFCNLNNQQMKIYRTKQSLRDL